MSNTFFNIFPNENFIDLCMYQFGYEQCDPGHSFGPATRNHYLFHYVLSGTGTLMANNSKGETRTYSVKSGQGFMIFPGQINTYIADEQLPWKYMWIEFDGLRVKEDKFDDSELKVKISGLRSVVDKVVVKDLNPKIDMQLYEPGTHTVQVQLTKIKNMSIEKNVSAKITVE